MPHMSDILQNKKSQASLGQARREAKHVPNVSIQIREWGPCVPLRGAPRGLCAAYGQIGPWGTGFQPTASRAASHLLRDQWLCLLDELGGANQTKHGQPCTALDRR